MRRALLGCAVLAVLAGPAWSQANYPNRPVRIVVPSSPGGGTDISARVIADHLGRAFKGQFFVENRPGAGQSIGIEAAARSEPDGYTLLMAASTLALNPIMYKNIKYDPVKDFAPVSQVASIPNVVLVHPSVPAKTLKEFIALAKSKPGALTYASAGIGTSPHMGAELLKHMAGIDIQHIPFRGSGPAVTDTISGRISMTLASTLQARPLVEGGQLRALAVTGSKRSEAMPDVPTVAEAGVPGYEALQWYGLLVPAGTPAEIVNRLQEETSKALSAPEVKKRLADDGAESVGTTPAEFAKFIKEEIEKWSNVARVANIKPE
ncbi:MAG: tripartite tricarboxylate transporter substrate binding protein [Pseudomonadota bacterium]